jgi:hypothetical protein
MAGLVGLAVAVVVGVMPPHAAADPGPTQTVPYALSGEMAGDPDVPVNPRTATTDDMSGEPEPGPIPAQTWTMSGPPGFGHWSLRLSGLVGLVRASAVVPTITPILLGKY